MRKSQQAERRNDETAKPVAPDRHQRVRRLVEWNAHDAGVCVRCEEAVSALVGLRVRRQKALRTIERCCDELGPWRWIDRRADVEFAKAPSGEDFERYLNRMMSELARIASEPFTPKLLSQALPITNRERLRWMKDNRLPRYGSIVVRRGQAIAVPIYAAELVEHLASNPEIIEAWRNADRDRGLAV